MKLNLWNKVVLGAKFLFGRFESATDYLALLLSSFLGRENVAAHVQETREYVIDILSYMEKYEKFCPAIWVPHYEKLMAAIQTLVDVLEDGKVTAEEISATVDAVNNAINEWMK